MKRQHKNCLNLIGQKFGRLTVVERDEDKVDPKSGKHKTKWLCDCDCGTKNYSVMGVALTSGATRSCGCLHREVSSETLKNSTHRKKYNKYDLSNNYGIGYTNKEEIFYFDLEDYEKIKDICWHKNDRGYIVGHDVDNKKEVKLHQLVVGEYDKNSLIIDHINSDHKEDNRKSNLRITSQQNNTFNRKRPSNNTSGKTGVSYNNKYNKWVAYIKCDGKSHYLGCFENKDDAIKARIKAEQKYFGEYQYIGETP